MRAGKITNRILGIALVAVLIGAMLPLGALTGHGQVRAAPATIYVPDDYSTIQAAVDGASPGDTIIVRDGTYHESVRVNKDHLTIQSENGAEKTIVQAPHPNDHIFEVTADYVSISELTIKWGNNAVTLHQSNDCVIKDNKFIENLNSIMLDQSKHNVFSRNTFVTRVVYTDIGTTEIIIGATEKSHYDNTIHISNTQNNRPMYYYFDKHDKVVEGIDTSFLMLAYCSNMEVRNSNVDTGSGIRLVHSTNNRIHNNTSTGNYAGVLAFRGSTGNSIHDNVLVSNLYGVAFSSGSGSNSVHNNEVASNKWTGVSIYHSDNNAVYLNNIVGNDSNADSMQSSANTWQSPEPVTYIYNDSFHTNYLGNFWSDYTGTDADGDGVGDAPYLIDSDADNYPLMEPFHNYLTTSGGIGDWNMTTSLPQGRRYHTSVEHSGNIYVIGGYPPHTTDVWYSRVHGDGSLSTWQSTTSLPDYRAVPTSVVHKGHVYVVGGLTWHVSHDDVWYSLINLDGTLGPWMSTTALPEPRSSHASVVHNNYLYVLGGSRRFSQTHQRTYNDVWYAEINSDGTVGSWVSTTALPVASSGHTAVIHDSHLYVIDRSDIWFARINSDGSLGNWTPTNPLPVQKGSHTSVLHDGYVYVIGGGPHWDFDTVWYAPIHSDGTVGNWNQATSLIRGRASHSSVVFGRYVYAIGGYNYWAHGYFSDVEYAPFLSTAQAVGRTVLIESLGLTHGPYTVGQTLTATFKVENTGDADVTLDKLLLGGRYNGGELPGGGFPDFTHQTVTLQPGQPPHEYEGSFTIPEPGTYDFFIAYYIENPTEAEKQFLDENNWNTCIELGEGLTDADRTRQIFVTESHLPILERLSHRSATPGTKVTLFGENFGHHRNGGYVSFGATLSNQVIGWTPEGLSHYMRVGVIYALLPPPEQPFLYAIEITRWEDTEIEVIVPDDYGLGLGEAKMAFKMLTLAVTLGASGPFAAALETLIGFIPDFHVYEPELEVDEYNQVKPTWENWGIIALAIGSEKIPGFAVSPTGEITVPVMVTTAAGESNSLLFTFSGQAMLIDVEPSLMAHWASPCELRVYDSQGRVSGLVEGELKAEIPADSWLLQDAILISNAADSYYFEVVGTGEGTYGLTILYSKEGKTDKFIATDIPTSTSAVHQYTIDWEALAGGEKGVTALVDADGDGVFERSFAAGGVLAAAATATGTGTAFFTPSHGVIEDLEALPAIPPGAPAGVIFPHGMFGLNVTGLSAGDTATITIDLPEPIPVGTVWWKYQNGAWYSLPNETDNGDSTMTITLTDGGLGDADGVADGVITDPGGPGIRQQQAPTAGAVYPTWTVLLAGLMAGASLLMLRRRRGGQESA